MNLNQNLQFVAYAGLQILKLHLSVGVAEVQFFSCFAFGPDEQLRIKKLGLAENCRDNRCSSVYDEQ